MVSIDPATLEERVLTLAPTGRDSLLACKAIRAAGLRCEPCSDIQDLCQKLKDGAGTALITDEALGEGAAIALQQALATAPAWSDLPLIVLTMSGGQHGPMVHEDDSLSILGNVTFVERPVRAQTLVTAVQSALRARRRQYQVRDLLQQHQKAVERMDDLAEIASHLLLSDRPEEIVASVFSKIAAHLDLEIYLCYLLDERTKSLRLSSHVGLPEPMRSQRAWLNLHESFCGAVAEERKRRVAERIQISDQRDLAHIKALGIRAYACFPLLANGHLIGTLSFGVRDRDQLHPDEVSLLETVCNQVAVAIERQRTEEELHELNEALEKRVAERTAQLQETNEQMEAFTYSISHDLRAPLRAIRGFAQALTEDYGSALDDTGHDYLARMSEGAERLDKLIQDLLQYSRLSRSTLTFEPIALDRAVKVVLHQLNAELLANHASVHIQQPLPSVLGHQATLEQVVVNLLSNAQKFVAPNVHPHIRIWGTSQENTARLWIEDNGIGIAPANHHRIFGVFERLHGTDSYPGTGIGLAIVAKAVTRMGGTVGLESAIGEGSRFWIELPRPPHPQQ